MKCYIFSFLFLLFQSANAQGQNAIKAESYAQSKRAEVFVVLGGHFPDEVFEGRSPERAMYIGGQYIFNVTERNGICLRAGIATHKISKMKDFFIGYRLSFRPRKPTRFYLETGIGFSDPIPVSYSDLESVPASATVIKEEINTDEATKISSTGAIGIKHFLGKDGQFSIGLEYRSILFLNEQNESFELQYVEPLPNGTSTHTRSGHYKGRGAIRELSLVLGVKLQ